MKKQFCSQNVAFERNARRNSVARVPAPVLARMATLLEPPQPSVHAWEQATITWGSTATGAETWCAANAQSMFNDDDAYT